GRASVPPRREPSDMERDVNPPEQGDEYARRPNSRRRPHPPHDPRCRAVWVRGRRGSSPAYPGAPGPDLAEPQAGRAYPEAEHTQVAQWSDARVLRRQSRRQEAGKGREPRQGHPGALTGRSAQIRRSTETTLP